VSGSLRQLREIASGLDGLARVLDPSCWEPDDARCGLEVASRIAKAAEAFRTLLAARVEACGLHTRTGYLSAAHLLASSAGSSLREAQAALATAKRLDDQPELSAAFRAGDVSLEQASESGRSLDRQGPGNA
jgi:hypothetical protein